MLSFVFKTEQKSGPRGKKKGQMGACDAIPRNTTEFQYITHDVLALPPVTANHAPLQIHQDARERNAAAMKRQLRVYGEQSHSLARLVARFLDL
jgi:hypothetical protein